MFFKKIKTCPPGCEKINLLVEKLDQLIELIQDKNLKSVENNKFLELSPGEQLDIINKLKEHLNKLNNQILTNQSELNILEFVFFRELVSKQSIPRDDDGKIILAPPAKNFMEATLVSISIIFTSLSVILFIPPTIILGVALAASCPPIAIIIASIVSATLLLMALLIFMMGIFLKLNEQLTTYRARNAILDSFPKDTSSFHRNAQFIGLHQCIKKLPPKAPPKRLPDGVLAESPAIVSFSSQPT